MTALKILEKALDSRARDDHPPLICAEVSFVVPIRNEAENIGDLIRQIDLACAGKADFEIIVVNDGSQDGSAEIVRDVARRIPNVRLLNHDRSGGQSAAIHSGVTHALGRIICTLDGDGQNPASELPKLFMPFLEPDAPPDLGLVAGQRVGRQDSWSKKTASRLANSIRAMLLRDGTRDTGCGLKAFRREAFLALPYFDHMHRYLPALFARDGWRIVHVDVRHAPRTRGTSKYSNLQRGLVGIVDLFGVAWLQRRAKKSEVVGEMEPK